jgi:hypothetical protein
MGQPVEANFSNNALIWIRRSMPRASVTAQSEAAAGGMKP